MLYFAYGSNLLLERIQARVPQARLVCVGRVIGWRFAFNLRSVDGSAKANVLKTGLEHDTVHGVLYELDEPGKKALDGFEDLGGAYRIENVIAETTKGRREAYLYVGNEDRCAENLSPYDWYRGLILAGARQHSLAPDFITLLETSARTPDPDLNRSTTNWRLIPPALR